MNYFWIFIISALSIALPVSATLARLQRLSKRYLPLAVLLWVGLLNEGTSYIMIVYHRNNMANSNMYTLIEFGLFLWLFYRLSNQKIMLFLVMGITGSVAWIADNVLFHSIRHDNAVFRMLSSILVVYLSIDKINQVTSVAL